MKSKIYDEFYCSDYKPSHIREQARPECGNITDREVRVSRESFWKQNSVRVAADTTRKTAG